MAPVDLGALARDVVGELEPLADAKSIDLGVADAERAIVDAGVASLRTLLANLVDNAIRYTPPGGRVDVAVRSERDRCTLAVRDDGPGIAPAERERVFTRFARGTAVQAQGSGLGLAIVRSIAERHGASVALEQGIGGRGLGVVVRFARSAQTLPGGTREPAPRRDAATVSEPPG
jgi:signal transduction histidine kinase